jgi:hypothetical protein
MSQLPPYSAHGPAEGSIRSAQVTSNTIAGNVQTCSIKDRQHDYYKVIPDSSISYHVCLTVDPTPIYRIELTKDPSAAGDIIIFPSSGPSSLPVAAARFGKNPKRGRSGGYDMLIITTLTGIAVAPFHQGPGP